MVSELLKNVLVNIAIYSTVIAIVFLLLNFLTKGFIKVYLQVKGSRGKTILVRVLGINGFYYRKGWFKHDQKLLHYKSRTKNSTGSNINQFVVDRLDIITEMGVSLVTWDETRNIVIRYDGEQFEGHKTGHIDDIIVRAIQFSKKEDMLLFVIIILIVIAIGLSGYAAYTSYSIQKQIPQIIQIINQSRVGVIV